MEWREEGFVTGYRLHGESSLILEAFTLERGRVMGYVKGGRSKRLRSVVQPGNRLSLTWRARTQDRLGTFAIDLVEDRSLAFAPRDVMMGHLVACGHMRLFPERQPAAEIFRTYEAFSLQANDRLSVLNLLVRFELAVLAAAGFALDLSRCAVSGEIQDLAYVSPKTGRAVGRVAGEPWKGKLLPLPAFLLGPYVETNEDELQRGFELSGEMLRRTLYAQGKSRPLPDERAMLLRR